MDIINEKVRHNKFGNGTILSVVGNLITIGFDMEEKTFQYPESFKQFLRFENEELNILAQAEIKNKEMEFIKNKLVQDEARNELQQRAIKTEPNRLKKKDKKYNRENIAFKCNFCDGGKTDTRIGFAGICSDPIIRYNIEKAKHVWCSSADSPCHAYLKGNINREVFESTFKDRAEFVCYESEMLTKWKASAGIVQTGAKKGTPMRLEKVQKNSLVVLTTRDPNTTDESRYIFAAFIVDECSQGDESDAGYVSTNSDYKIALTPNEARQIKFWNYYKNKNAPNVIKFGSGLHRYLDDMQAAQILKDICTVKMKCFDEEKAKDIFKYYCDTNNIDINNISDNEGGLIFRE